MVKVKVEYVMALTQNKMDSGTKDSLANITTIGGLGMTMADVQITVSILVLVTALLLNISRLYDWWKKRQLEE